MLSPRRQALFRTYLVIQVAGILSLLGGEKFDISSIGYHCRIFAIIVLEPGEVIMQPLAEKLLWGTSVTLSQMYWLANVAAFLLDISLARILLEWRNAPPAS